MEPSAQLTHLDVAAKLRALGISGGHASEIARRKRPPGERTALKIWRETGMKFGKLANLEDDEIEVFAKAVEQAA